MAVTLRSRDAALLALQAPTGIPRSSTLDTITDPANPPRRSQDLLSHFYEGLYDLSPESHLTRFVKVLLGDASVGSLRKRYLVARTQSMLLTSRYSDLDRFYGGLFGLKRLTGEVLPTSPYATATPAEWDIIDARDSSYRARVEQFSRSLMLAGTPEGLAGTASAILGGTEVRVYETFVSVDLGLSPGYGRTTPDNRSEFIVRPQRPISTEETYALVRVLERLKPASALMTIDSIGTGLYRPVVLRDVATDSAYWEVETQVAARVDVASAYPNADEDSTPMVQPRPAFTGYQGEAWSYNGDIAAFSSYTEAPAGDEVLTRYNYERVESPSATVDYTPDRAFADQTSLLLGRYASDGVLSSSPFSPTRRVSA